VTYPGDAGAPANRSILQKQRWGGLTSDHKYLRICDLCKELEISAARCIIATERERQAKTDALFGAFVPVN
jgi:hypothetical protein